MQRFLTLKRQFSADYFVPSQFLSLRTNPVSIPAKNPTKWAVLSTMGVRNPRKNWKHSMAQSAHAASRKCSDNSCLLRKNTVDTIQKTQKIAPLAPMDGVPFR